MGNRFPIPVGGAIPPCRGAQAVTAGAHQLSLPLRNGWNIVAIDRLLIAIGEQDERYGSERYDDQRSKGGAKIGFPVVGCLVVRHRDLRLSALIANACTGSRFPASVATRRNPALSRTQASSPRCCEEGEVKDWQLVEQHGLWWAYKGELPPPEAFQTHGRPRHLPILGPYACRVIAEALLREPPDRRGAMSLPPFRRG